MSDNWKNQLYFGDNLDILKELYHQHPEGFIDLIYIDPPFNSKRDYNVLFESIDLTDSTAQKEAFTDTWSNISYLVTLYELSDLDISLYNFLKNLDNTNISKGAISYLVTMAIRLWYIHKILKPTGSFYLHCDPTMSHYLKVLCDLVFGEKNYRNEINWRRSNPKSNTANNLPNCRDVILRYTKTNKFIFNKIFLPLDKAYTDKAYYHSDEKGNYQLLPLLNPNDNRPNLTYEFLGITRVWRWTKERMQKAYEDGLIVQVKEGAVPRYKKYLHESEGRLISNDWNDIEQVSNNEALGYPTQKPEELLERIIKMSTNEDDLVADFFCGCGTAISVAQSMNRKWIGVDISHLAVKLMTKRLIDSYGEDVAKTFEIHGFPKDIDSARELANNVKGGRLEFEDWIIEVLLHGITNERRNEMGYDGYRTFTINEKKYIVMIEVKSGGANPTQLHHFMKTVEAKNGAIGIFVCFEEQITRNMRTEAKKEGLFMDDFGNSYCDKFQIISVQDLLEGKYPQIPQSKYETFKKAEKKTTEADTQIKMEM
jgi:DNA modification methylase